MGYYNLPLTDEELKQDLKKIKEKYSEDFAKRLEQLYKVYRGILSGEITNINNETCDNLVFFEKLMNEDSASLSDKELKKKYSNMSMDMVLEHITTYWRVVMWQTSPKYEHSGLKEDYKRISDNSNDKGKEKANDLKFYMWQVHLLQKYNLFTTEEKKFREDIIDNLQSILTLTEDSFNIFKTAGVDYRDNIKKMEEALGVNIDDDLIDQINGSLVDIKSYARNRMQDMANRVTKGTNILPYVHIQNLSDELPELDKDVITWKATHKEEPKVEEEREKEKENNLQRQEEDLEKQENPDEDNNKEEPLKEEQFEENPPEVMQPAMQDDHIALNAEDNMHNYPVLDLQGEDSPLMREVKDAVASCENMMKISTVNADELKQSTDMRISPLEESILVALNACRKYCINRDPSSKSGIHRLETVKETRQMLKRQYSQLATVRRLIGNPAKRQDGYPKGDVSIKELIEHVNTVEEADQGRAVRDVNDISNLKYGDFVEALSPWNSDYVEFHKGKLRTATNVLNSVNWWWRKPDNTNKEMREKLAQLALSQEIKSRRIHGMKTSQEFKNKRIGFYRNKLGLNDVMEQLRPLKMKDLREFIEFVDLRCSRVNTIAKFSDNFSSKECSYAHEVSSQLMIKDSNDFNSRKKNQIKKIRDIIDEGKKQGINLKISGKRVEELATGHISAIGDIAYSFMDGTRRLLESFNKGNYSLTNSTIYVKKIMAYAVKIEASATEEEKEKVRSEARRYCLEHVFNEVLNNGDLLKEIDKYRLPELSTSTDGLREYVVGKFPTVKAWKGKESDVAEGVVLLEKLCNLMNEYRKILDNVCRNGMDQQRCSQLTNVGHSIMDILRSGSNMEKMNLVAKNIPKTRFKLGIDKLQEYLKDDSFNYNGDFITTLVEKTTKNEQNGPIRVEKNIKTAEEKLALLPEESKLIAEILLQKASPSEIIRKLNEKAEKITYLLAELEDLKTNKTVAKIMNTGQTTVEFGVNNNGFVYFIIDAVQFDTTTKPDTIAGYIKRDLCSNVDKYGLQTVWNILGKYIKNAAAGNDNENIITEEMLYDLLNKTLKMDKTPLRDFKKEEMAIWAEKVISRQLNNLPITADEVLKGLRDLSGVKSEGTLLDRNVAESVEALENKSKNETLESKIQFSGEFDMQPVEKDAVVWTDKEMAVKDLISDLIWPSEAWKYEITNRNNPSDRMRYTIYTHADTIAMLIQEQELLENVVNKLGLKELNKDVYDLIYNKDDGILNKLRVDYWLQDKEHLNSVSKLLKTCERKDLSNIIRGLVGNADDVEKASESMQLFIDNIEKDKLLKELAVNHIGILIDVIKIADENKANELLNKSKAERKAEADRKAKEEKIEKADADNKIEEKVHKLTKTDLEIINLVKDKMSTAEFLGFKLKGKDVLDTIRQKLKIKDILAAVDNHITNVVHNGVMPTLQESINDSLNKNMFNEDEDVFKDVNDMEIYDMLINNITGESGQGLFYKKILQGYFVEAGENQQREMIASALRELKPSQITKDITDKDKKDELAEIQMGSLLSGLFKGAGPLLHKTLQGVPTKDLSLGMQKAMDDVKSHLRSIPKELVATQMNSMLEQTKGGIEKVKIKKSLGAASVGEAFLCDLSGKEVGDKPKEVVIKLLRPDVRKKMELDKKFFMKCARETNEGMGRTFANQMSIYEQELDLTQEAKNIREGRVYNEGKKCVQSEEIEGLVEPGGNYIALKKAEGTTVGDLFRKIKEQQNNIYETYPEKNQQLSRIRDLSHIAEGFQNQQGFLIELAKKWVTEAIFNNGFYQADLHKDNLMINNSKVTIIDYGNATLLSDEQKKEITYMVMCAGFAIADDFAKHYANLLSEESKNIYDKAKEQEFVTMVRSVFEKKGDIGSKILVVLMEAQKMGLELPTAVYNFSQGQLRLQNTIDDGNDIFRRLAITIDKEVSEYWKKDEKSIFYEFRKIYLDNPNKEEEDIESEIKTILGRDGNERTEAEQEKIYAKWAELCNKIFTSDGKEIKELADCRQQLVTALHSGYDALKTQFDSNNTLPLTAEKIKSDQKLHRNIVSFIDDLCMALKNEARIYVNAQEIIKKANSPADFIEVMADVVGDHKKETKNIIGTTDAVKYALYVNNYEKTVSKWEEKDNKITDGDIENLIKLCKKIGDISAEMTKYKKPTEQPMRDDSKRFIESAVSDIATCLCQIPDRVIPLQSKKYILERLKLFNEKKAMADFEKNKDGASKKISWIDNNSLQQLYSDPANKERLYDFRNAMRLVRGYLDRTLRTKKGQKFAVERNVEVDQALDEIQQSIDGLKADITQKEFKRILTEREKAKNPVKKEAGPDKNQVKDGDNRQEEIKEDNSQKKNKNDNLKIDDLFSNIKEIVGKDAEEEEIAKEPFLKYVDNIFDVNAVADDAEYYEEYDKYLHRGKKLDRDLYIRLNSNDPEVLKALRDDDSTKMRPRLRSHLDYRIDKLESINKQVEIRNKTGEISKPVSKPISEPQNIHYMLEGVVQKSTQNSFYGCWSVALATLLKYRGVDLDQKDIRAYRPDVNCFSEEDMSIANRDTSNNLVHYTDLVQRFLPTTMVNEMICDQEMTEKDAAKLLGNCIAKALGEHNSPLTILYGGHYRTICKLEGSTVSYYDPTIKDMQTKLITEMVKECGYTYKGEDGNTKTKFSFVANWFQDMKLNIHREPELGEELIANGASYLGNELTHATSEHTNATNFKGYSAGDINGVRITSYLPTTIKIKNEIYRRINISALNNISNAAKAEDNVNDDVKKVLEEHPKGSISFMAFLDQKFDGTVSAWVDTLQSMYKEKDKYNNVDRTYIDYALEEVRCGYLLDEKKQLMDEINKNFRSDGDIMYFKDNDKAAKMREIIEKAMYIHYVESLDLHGKEWLTRASKKLFFGEDERKLLAEQGVMKLLDDMKTNSDTMRKLREYDAEIPPLKIACGEDILFVKLLTDIEKGKFPETEALKSMLAEAERKTIELDKKVRNHQEALLKNPGLQNAKQVRDIINVNNINDNSAMMDKEGNEQKKCKEKKDMINVIG